MKRVDLIQAKYELHETGYDNVVEFLSRIKLIEYKDDVSISITNISKLGDNLVNLNEVVCENLFLFTNDFTSILHEFLSDAGLDFYTYEVNLSYQTSTRYSELRNFLIDLGVIDYNSSLLKYYLNPDRQKYILDFIDTKNKFTINSLLEKQDANRKLGEQAELEIIKYEKERLRDFDYLHSSIRHTAKLNVNAGYDIRSYESPLETAGILVPRYIEVKAVSISNYKFHMAASEITKATVIKNNYYLYLLPVKDQTNFILSELKIIKNPVSELFNKSLWFGRPDGYTFSLKEIN